MILSLFILTTVDICFVLLELISTVRSFPKKEKDDNKHMSTIVKIKKNYMKT